MGRESVLQGLEVGNKPWALVKVFSKGIWKKKLAVQCAQERRH